MGSDIAVRTDDLCRDVPWNISTMMPLEKKTPDLLRFLVVWQKKSVYGGNFSLESVKGD